MLLKPAHTPRFLTLRHRGGERRVGDIVREHVPLEWRRHVEAGVHLEEGEVPIGHGVVVVAAAETPLTLREEGGEKGEGGAEAGS